MTHHCPERTFISFTFGREKKSNGHKKNPSCTLMEIWICSGFLENKTLALRKVNVTLFCSFKKQ